MKRQLPSQTLEEQFLSPSTRKAPLSESIRLGAQLMLQKAVELEVTEFLGRDHYHRTGDGVLQSYRNGYEDEQVQTADPATFSVNEAWRLLKAISESVCPQDPAFGVGQFFILPNSAGWGNSFLNHFRNSS